MLSHILYKIDLWAFQAGSGLNHSSVALVVYIAQVNLCSSLVFTLFLAPSISPSMLTASPVPANEKYPTALCSHHHWLERECQVLGFQLLQYSTSPLDATKSYIYLPLKKLIKIARQVDYLWHDEIWDDDEMK